MCSAVEEIMEECHQEIMIEGRRRALILFCTESIIFFVSVCGVTLMATTLTLTQVE